MNKLRNLKNRSNNVLTIGGGGGSQSTLATSPPASASNGTSGGGGMFTKLSKRYANMKFMRQQPGRQGAAAHQPVVSTGSYDLTTAELKREIGAPVLISKTCIDMDTTECRVDGRRIIEHKSLPSSPAAVGTANGADESSDTRFDYGRTIDGVNPLGHPCGTSTVLRKRRSKSASNLHKSELRVFLQRAPSMKDAEPNNNEVFERSNGGGGASGDANRTYDVRLRPLRCGDDEDNDSSLHTLSVVAADSNAVTMRHRHHHRKSTSSAASSSASSSAYNQHQQRMTRSPSATYSSKDSLRQQQTSPTTRSSREASYSRDSLAETDLGSGSGAGAPETTPQNPFDRHDDVDDDGGESPMLRRLNASDLFRSIDELNAITVRNDETATMSSSAVGAEPLDREYCEHRDQLRPDQRRITLLRNKGTMASSVLHLNAVKRERLGNAWSGLKNWIGEEGGRIKEVVHKHAAMQRVGGVPHQRTIEQQHRNFVEAEMGCRGEADRDGVLRPAGSSSKPSSTTTSSRSVAEDGEGQNGFEELRRYVKQGGDFGKDLATILQERVDAEQLYAKSLSKMASKLNKACRDIPGSLADGWRGVAAEMESRSEMHRLFSTSMGDEIVKPLRALLENQHKTRKAIENAVDKSARVLAEWRCTEAKAKKSSHTAARDNEKVQDAMLDVRIQRSPSVAMLHHQVNNNNQHPTSGKSPDNREQKLVDRDCAKLDGKRRKAEESVKRADVEYYTLCVRAERARVEWELAVLRGSTVLQSHENQRLVSLKAHLADYARHTQLMNPAAYQLCERLAPYVDAGSVQKDMQVVRNIRRAAEGPAEQLLPDFYCEHTTLAMNRERRRQSLVKLLQLVRTDLERERKSRSGLQLVAQSLNAPDNQNVTDKLYHIRSMLTYLEGARFKLQSALLELDQKPRAEHPLAEHIQITRDRTGLQQSILKVPLWLRNGDDGDRLHEEYGNADADLGLDGGGSIADGEDGVQNDVLIKHFDRNFKRSQSSLEMGGATTVVLGAGGDIAPICNTKINHNNNNHTNNKHSRRSTSPVFDRGQADGGSNQPDSDFDEFSSQDEDDSEQTMAGKRSSKIGAGPAPMPVLSRCRAIYSYEPKLYDELEIATGDLIEVHAKQEDGWWLGALNKKVGIFPATYVEELQ